MKVLITGGAGFIGSYLCKFYYDKGYDVWCIDNCVTGAEENVVSLSSEKSFHFIKEDITSFHLESLPEKFRYVFHLASPASPADYLRLPTETLLVNSLGTKKCLDFALKHEASFLFASTSEVYGDPLVTPQKEEYWGNVNPIGPRSVYDEGKRFGEALVMAYHRKFGIKTYLPRIFNTYGPRMRLNDGRVVPNFIACAIKSKPLVIYGDGKQTRSFCYVEDLVRGLTLLIESDYHLPVNLGNPSEFTVIELAEKIQKITGKKLPVEFGPPLPDDPRQRKPDISVARKVIGWEPAISLEDGLLKTYTYYLSQLSHPSHRSCPGLLEKKEKGG
jgi:dTDP-glucose 4,6-dehydratase